MRLVIILALIASCGKPKPSTPINPLTPLPQVIQEATTTDEGKDAITDYIEGRLDEHGLRGELDHIGRGLTRCKKHDRMGWSR